MISKQVEVVKKQLLNIKKQFKEVEGISEVMDKLILVNCDNRMKELSRR